MKKFYKLASTSGNDKDGYVVLLDGKPVRTPGGRALAAPTQALADKIALEWAGQKDTIIPESMPLTQILTTALDYAGRERPALEGKVLAYLDTDLLCYRAAQPPGVAERQAALWDPWLIWFEKRYGAPLQTTTGLAALTQPNILHNKVKAEIAALSGMRFCVLQLVTSLAGSLVLALAFNAGDASPEQVFAATQAEENYKAEIYNEAEHGAAPMQEKGQAAMKRDLEAARIFLELL